jgi:hypothetical protein
VFKDLIIQSINTRSLIQFLKLRSVVFYVFIAGVLTDKVITAYFKAIHDCAIHLHPYHWGAYSTFHRAKTCLNIVSDNLYGFMSLLTPLILVTGSLWVVYVMIKAIKPTLNFIKLSYKYIATKI